MSLAAVRRKRIVIHAGELVFGRGSSKLRTLLGSCVAITLWHPRLRLGGMCHFALPRRPKGVAGKPDARYGDDCIDLFRHAAGQRGTELSEYEACIYGGGNLLNGVRQPERFEYADVETSPVGDSNAAQAFSLLLAEGTRILEADVGEQGYRKVEFDPVTGTAWVEFVPIESR